jgi:hydrogenase nickel incorporation protein HypA/HybF
VKVGRLTCVEPDALRLSFEALKRGTPLAGAILSIESVPIRGDCRSCQREFVLEEMELTCPDCGSFGIDLRTGRELLVDSLEVES